MGQIRTSRRITRARNEPETKLETGKLSERRKVLYGWAALCAAADVTKEFIMPNWVGIPIALFVILAFLYFAFIYNRAPRSSDRRNEDFSQNDHFTHHVDGQQ
jgi:hypothetical protein